MLVICFGGIVIPEAFDLRDDLSGIVRLYRRNIAPYFEFVRRVNIVDACPVLCSYVVSLTIARRRVDDAKKQRKYVFKAYLIFIITHPYRFGKIRISAAHIFIGRANGPPIGLADLRTDHAGNLIIIPLHAPEAAACQKNFFHSFPPIPAGGAYPPFTGLLFRSYIYPVFYAV